MKNDGSERYKRYRKYQDEYQKKWKEKNPERYKESRQKWLNENKEKRNRWQSEYRKKKRIEALSHYSDGTPMCACCGELEKDFLTFDHIDGGGNKQRIEITGSKTNGLNLPLWLFHNKYPDGFQVLCHNCNCAKHKLGVCPHKLKGMIKEEIENIGADTVST